MSLLIYRGRTQGGRDRELGDRGTGWGGSDPPVLPHFLGSNTVVSSQLGFLEAHIPHLEFRATRAVVTR